MGRVQVGIVNLMGVVYLDPLDNPLTRRTASSAPACRRSPSSISTRRPPAKRRALLIIWDGRVSAVFGTHTHVQTADEQVLPQGTGYLSDLA